MRPLTRAGRIILWGLLILTALLVWPTRWRIVTTDARVYRVDRVTGCYQFATDTGWSRPWQRTC